MEYACDAIVIGGGAAGIAAAREFTSSGLRRVLVLEARSRVGGRAYTSDELGCGVPLDHGAQWIHGFSLQHPMVKLAETAGVVVTPMAGSRSMARHSNGQAMEDNHIQAADRAYQKLKVGIRNYSQKHGASDITWSDAVLAGTQADSLEQAFAKFLGAHDEGLELRRSLLHQRIYASVENYEGARIDRWSAIHHGEGSCLRGGNGDVVDGYGSLIAGHACSLEVKFGRCVSEIMYPEDKHGNVTVCCDINAEDGCHQEKYIASMCVVTLPLGVLRHGNVSFRPSLPLDKQEAIARLGIGLMDKVELLWERRWWPANVGSLTIASLDSTPTYHPWPWFLEPPEARQHPLGWAVLVCYITGQFAEEIESMKEDTVAAICAHALGEAFSCDVPNPKDIYISRWGQDPCSRGAWTYFAANSSIEDVRALAEPLGRNGCVGFAGEHTCDGSSRGLDIGTVHGAWLSGIRAAKAVLARSPPKFSPPPRRCAPTNPPISKRRTDYRHITDTAIPTLDDYVVGTHIIVTSEPSEVAEEFEVDPDEKPNITAAQSCCGKRGTIVSRSQWGWLRVAFEDGTQSHWFTPFCLWILTSAPTNPPISKRRTDYRHIADIVIPTLDDYVVGAHIIVTSDPSEVADEFEVDPDEKLNITAAQSCCGKRGSIVSRSQWGWLRVAFEDGTQSRWFTPFCLWILTS